MSVEEEAAILAPFKACAEKGELVEISEIVKAYQSAVDHPVSTGQIYFVLHRHGWRKIMPRSRHPQKASEEEIAASKKINDTVKELEVIHSGKKIRLMFQDEAGFGRINKPKYCWCQEGIRPSVRCHHIREYRYAYGAVESLTGDGYFLVMPYCNTVCMNIFLKKLSERFSNDIILLCIFWLLDQKLGHFTDWSNCHLKLCTGETCKTKIVIQRYSANNSSMFTDSRFHHLRSFFGQLIQAEPDGLADART